MSFDEISRPRPEHVPWGPPYWDEFFDDAGRRFYHHPNGQRCTMRESMYLYEALEESSKRIHRKQWRARRQLAESFVGPYRISTVFSGIDLDLSMFGGPPTLFETLVFERERSYRPPTAELPGHSYHKEIDELGSRYHTRDEALHGHWAIRKLVRRWLQLANGPAGGWKGKK